MRGVTRRSLVLGAAGALAAPALGCAAAPDSAAARQPDAAEQDFAAFLGGVRRDAAARGVSRATLDAALSGLAPLAEVIRLDRRQPEGRQTLEAYLAAVVSRSRVEGGRRRLAQHRAALDAVAADYGVEPELIVALWGVETSFGAATGGTPVIAALATLAHDGRRSAFFRAELLDALTILDEGHVPLARMRGSWAGAMGQCQFMPSSFRRYAVDRDGDGRRDIWTTPADVFASIANYMANVGWRRDLPWGREARLPSGFDRTLIGEAGVRPIAAWRRAGVTILRGAWPADDAAAGLIQPTGPEGRAFLVTETWRSVLRWNRSTFFALSVGLMVDALGSGGQA